MSAPRFQADVDFNQKAVRGLRRREPRIDILTAEEGGVIGLPDPEVLVRASTTDRILLSHDSQTMPLHFSPHVESQTCAGLILVEQNLPLGEMIEELLLIWSATDHAEWQNCIDFVPLRS